MATTILPLPAHRHVTSLAWDPRGMRIAAACSDGSLWVWHVPSRRLLFSRTFKGAPLRSVAWDPTGKKLALGSSTGLSVLQASSGQLLLTHQFRAPVIKVSWSPVGSRFLVVSGNEVTVFFEAGFQRVEAYPTRVMDAAWRWDGVCIGSICAHGMVHVWDTGSNRTRYTLSDIRDPQSLVWDRQDRSLALGTREGTIQLRDPDTGVIQRMETLSRRAICTLTWGKPGIVAVTDRETTVWDARAQGQVMTIETIDSCAERRTGAPSAHFAPDGEQLATGHRGMVCIHAMGEPSTDIQKTRQCSV